MKNIFKFLISLILIGSLSNCIGIRAYKNPEIKPEELKISSVKKTKIFVTMGFKSSFAKGNIPQNALDKVESDQKRMFNEAIKESDCCEFATDKEEANINIDAIFYNDSDPAALYAAFVGGFTFTIVPTWVNSKMRVGIKASKGKMVKDYEFADSMLGITWLPFVLAMPFTNAIDKESEMNKNLYKNIIIKMKEDGIFNK